MNLFKLEHGLFKVVVCGTREEDEKDEYSKRYHKTKSIWVKRKYQDYESAWKNFLGEKSFIMKHFVLREKSEKCWYKNKERERYLLLPSPTNSLNKITFSKSIFWHRKICINIFPNYTTFCKRLLLPPTPSLFCFSFNTSQHTWKHTLIY